MDNKRLKYGDELRHHDVTPSGRLESRHDRFGMKLYWFLVWIVSASFILCGMIGVNPFDLGKISNDNHDRRPATGQVDTTKLEGAVTQATNPRGLDARDLSDRADSGVVADVADPELGSADAATAGVDALDVSKPVD